MKDVGLIIERVGSNVKVAARLGVTPSAVSEFKRRNSLPVSYWPKLIALGAECGVAVTPGELMLAHCETSP